MLKFCTYRFTSAISSSFGVCEGIPAFGMALFAGRARQSCVGCGFWSCMADFPGVRPHELQRRVPTAFGACRAKRGGARRSSGGGEAMPAPQIVRQSVQQKATARTLTSPRTERRPNSLCLTMPLTASTLRRRR